MPRAFRLIRQWAATTVVALAAGALAPIRASAAAPADELRQLAAEAEAELRQNILPFWMRHVPHPEREGFYGAVGPQGQPRPDAPRAALTTSRILWAFSAAFRTYGEAGYRAMADRAYVDLTRNFHDPEHGGVFWSLAPDGRPDADFKHVYVHAFAVYGLSEYYRATGESAALARALELFALLESRARDAEHGGYREAFDRSWQPLPPGARNVVGPPALKSQNTHLHVMEAYANLLRASGDARVRRAQRDLIGLILDRIVDPTTGHLGLFFTVDWQPASEAISPGHDIEFAWLVTEAAAELGDPELLRRVQALAARVAEVTLTQAVEPDGGIPYEVAPDGRVLQSHREWWVPAEAAVGFLNAYELTGDMRFFTASREQWQFIQRHLIDRQHGEWFHSVLPDGTVRRQAPKANSWKCPYHNGRACLELARRVRTLLDARTAPAAAATR